VGDVSLDEVTELMGEGMESPKTPLVGAATPIVVDEDVVVVDAP
jgi:hypothetical protein